MSASAIKKLTFWLLYDSEDVGLYVRAIRAFVDQPVILGPAHRQQPARGTPQVVAKVDHSAFWRLQEAKQHQRQKWPRAV